ncbi:MAG: ACT domain-containing protein [Ilumatobacteraceae bacterium]|nr:ACT domain-containing protein [Ilumatobacteraceae bacterium]
MQTYVLRLWLPDFPGTLGRVAAAIGQAGGDVIGIEILERGAGMAIDELIVVIPSDAENAMEQLIAEVSQVEGVAVEDVHTVALDRPDQSVLALDTAARIMESPRDERLEATCELVREMLESDWCTIMRRDTAIPLAVSGDVPDLPWVIAFLAGTTHLAGDAAHEHTPADIAWAPLDLLDAVIVVGRIRGAFRLRERQHVTLIARIVSSAFVGFD